MSFEGKSRRHSDGIKDGALNHGIKRVAIFREGNLRPQIFPVTAIRPIWHNIRIGI